MYLWKRGKQAAGLIKVLRRSGVLRGVIIDPFRLVTAFLEWDWR